jgi:hypothetical protein
MYFVNNGAEATSVIFLWTVDFLANNAKKATAGGGGQKN